MSEQGVDWHDRFSRQASWTRDLRDYLFARAGLAASRRILDVGCGTGVLASELLRRAPAILAGLDISFPHLLQARANAPSARLIQADAQALPVASGAFDLTFCHFLLLWVADPGQAVSEMARVTRPGGAVLALAEPDYGGRIDHPAALAPLGEWQSLALSRQGADVTIGRRLAEIFSAAGLREVETGILGGQWRLPRPFDESEWQVWLSDLGSLAEISISAAQLHDCYILERSARASGARVLFVPTFYAWGRV